MAKGASKTGRYRYDPTRKASKGKGIFTCYHPYEFGVHSMVAVNSGDLLFNV